MERFLLEHPAARSVVYGIMRNAATTGDEPHARGTEVGADGALSEAADWLTGLRDRQGLDLVQAAHVKLLHEAAELEAACGATGAIGAAGEGGVLEEAADVAICLAGVLAGRGLSLGDLGRAVLRKVEVNRGRRWVRQQDGTWQHGD